MKNRTIVLLITGLVTVLISCNEVPKKQTTIESENLSGNLYMDIHRNVDGLTAEGLMGAHKKDLEVQKKYGVNYLEYWYDEESGTVFCLVDAPSKEAAAKVHEEAHGLVADEIVAVNHGH